ncbi:GNAT family N-acetyltransferase [Hyphococcus luteus]|uniref:GNAT family N-acetyltransferase n=1 Tax=Hyphococcus luteus TaxID=2058213 RepID=A0A2S7JZL4_9PROT|nr:GNAT family N-acetyltransferase [Marinicaulis flavus]PQA85693.1 GNAT family N-acetyltransferase [Marinicaulis flavus]
MPDGSDAALARTIGSIKEIDPAQWNRLANPDPSRYNPFVSHEFLSALEQSKSVAPETGWAPLHLIVEEAGAVTGAAPLYVKGHSQGEYVFDHHWADALERAGGRYYPKLLSAAPFTPVPGPRLLAPNDNAKQTLAVALRQVTEQLGASSAHVNFITEDDKAALVKAGFMARMGEQYHWFNRGYETFDDFLAALASRKRKAVKKERREAGDGLVIRRLVGADITERYWDAFWLFYQDTGARKWGYPYLTRTFFRIIAETMADSLLLIVAERDGEPIAGALNFIGGDALYGRYWGCLEDVPFLHFELCYHQAVEFAIERGLSRVEAGAQGQHKIARGYEPVATWSAHWISNESFREAIARYLEAEREQTGMEIEALKDVTPFRKT